MSAEHLTKVLKLTALEAGIEALSEYGKGPQALGALTILQDMAEELKLSASPTPPEAQWESVAKIKKEFEARFACLNVTYPLTKDPTGLYDYENPRTQGAWDGWRNRALIPSIEQRK
jgi:hypothetical protein